MRGGFIRELKYKVRYEHDMGLTEDPVSSYLKKCGIEDVDLFLNPARSSCHDPLLLKHMENAVKYFVNAIILRNAKIMIKIDPDVDGYTSAAYLVNFIHDFRAEFFKKLGKELRPDPNYEPVQIILTDGKQHGLNNSFLPGNSEAAPTLDEYIAADLLIIPDAGSDAGTASAINSLRNLGMQAPVLILDHHPIEDEILHCAETIVVNCMDGQYPNQSLSGVGVVHKFIQAIVRTYNMPHLTDSRIMFYKELVALGLIADVMDLRSPESRYLVSEGLQYATRSHSFLAELEERCADSMRHGATIKSYGWSVAPLLNAMIRIGKREERENMFRALCGDSELVKYTPRRRSRSDPEPVTSWIPLEADVARRCSNAKARQDKQVRSAVDELKEHVTQEQLDTDSVIAIVTDDASWDSTMNGLIAGKLTNEFNRPVMLLRSVGNNLYAGSARGFEKSGIGSFKGLLEQTGLCDSALGHANAFGVRIQQENLRPLLDIVNELVPLSSMEVASTVDYEVQGGSLSPLLVQSIGSQYAIWGNGVPEPTFAITDIEIPAQEIKQYNNGRFISFNYNGVHYVKKYCYKNEYADITNSGRGSFGPGNKTLKLTVIGTFDIEEYEGKERPYVRISQWCSETVSDFKW